ncbi:hypothetical protein J31TS4_32860 [Paenibacillus sp. J31TS4]|uniref:YhcN/YlaJ family sporulation lipoprotein n=1 Tax=Paenibacillus sp. J31TS4 TaxID=2807195 RepID=UPI001B23DB00|nr:YhcN/YlaJ family sporulation lipoprotein [Paenibacillus sp. J31TS4]GIP40006.1 hypothetical protein J31TS4_32860 [Paenibacillus sp. J31TS4]
MNKQTRRPRTLLQAATVSALTVCLLAGCGTQQQGAAGGKSGMRSTSLPGGGTTGGGGGGGTGGAGGRSYGLDTLGTHRNTRMEWSPYLARKLEEVPGVQKAKALVTDSNVYVAVKLSDEVTRTDQTPPGMSVGLSDKRIDRPAPTSVPNIRSGIVGNSYDVHNGGMQSYNHDDDLSDMPRAYKLHLVEKVHSLSSPALQHVYVSGKEEFMKQMDRLETRMAEAEARSRAKGASEPAGQPEGSPQQQPPGPVREKGIPNREGVGIPRKTNDTGTAGGSVEGQPAPHSGESQLRDAGLKDATRPGSLPSGSASQPGDGGVGSGKTGPTLHSNWGSASGPGGPTMADLVNDFNLLAQKVFPTTDGTGSYGGSTSSSQLANPRGSSTDMMRSRRDGIRQR